jgi:hypothetical protein
MKTSEKELPIQTELPPLFVQPLLLRHEDSGIYHALTARSGVCVNADITKNNGALFGWAQAPRSAI